MRKLLLILGFFALSLGGAHAQADAKGPDALAQMQLTEPQIQQYLEAQPDMDALMNEASPQQESDTPDPKFIAKLEEIAKKHKFANYGDFDAVAGNIALVLEGVDEKTKKYIGAEPALKKQIAALQADKNIPAEDKKAELAELNGELGTIVPVKFKANIDLVLKYYDKLAADAPQKP